MMILSKTKKHMINGMWYAVSQVVKFEPQETLIVFSDPRGGSSWLAEIIGRLPRTAMLWEPLHLNHMNHFSRLNFAWRQHIPESATWPEAEVAFQRLFEGKVLNVSTCRSSSPFHFLRAERMLVKFCRASAMIPWLTGVFDFSYEPIYLVRHPFAVVASQLKHGAWDYDFKGFEIPDSPYNDLYRDHAPFLSSLGSKEEALVATWCLTNLVPLRNARNNIDWITVYYEDLLSDPARELQRIFRRWGLVLPDGLIEKAREPSSTAKETTFLSSVERQLAKWRAYFDQQQIERMMAVLRYFDVERYTIDLFPRL